MSTSRWGFYNSRDVSAVSLAGFSPPLLGFSLRLVGENNGHTNEPIRVEYRQSRLHNEKWLQQLLLNDQAAALLTNKHTLLIRNYVRISKH